jgi:plastocyanin
MRSSKRWPALAVIGAAAIVLPAVASSATTPIEAVNEGGTYGYGEHHRWSPSQETVIAGSAVTLRNPTEVPHGVEWRSAIKPSCDEGAGKVPVGTTPAASGTKWSGTCTFSQAGTYTFYCTVHGPEMTGTITVPGTASATTEEATEATQTTATLNGTIKPEGNTPEYHFQYGTGTVSEHSTSTLTLGSADFSSHHVSAALTGLTPSTKYHAQLLAVYGTGKTTVLGGEQTFTTAAPTPPTVATGNATVQNETEATLEGTVNPNGGEGTEYLFEYGTTSSYGQSTVATGLPPDSLNHGVSAALTGLTPGTEYHFRLAARNKPGSSHGGEHTFKTASPTTPTPAPPPSPPTATATTSSTATATPTTTTATATTTTTLAEAPAGPPILGSPALRASQRGFSVRGSLDVSPSAAGGHLEVDLLAKSASLANARHSGNVRVGRLVRTPVSAGRLSFSVQLTDRAKHALTRRHRLALTVKITLTPTKGMAVTVTRSVELHA